VLNVKELRRKALRYPVGLIISGVTDAIQCFLVHKIPFHASMIINVQTLVEVHYNSENLINLIFVMRIACVQEKTGKTRQSATTRHCIKVMFVYVGM